MTSTKFATELKANGFCIAGNRIVADDCPGVVWKPVMKGGHIDRASTLRKIIRERSPGLRLGFPRPGRTARAGAMMVRRRLEIMACAVAAINCDLYQLTKT
jgi:hypothetical protein